MHLMVPILIINRLLFSLHNFLTEKIESPKQYYYILFVLNTLNIALYRNIKIVKLAEKIESNIK